MKQANKDLIVSDAVNEAHQEAAFQLLKGSYWGHLITRETFDIQNANTKLYGVFKSSEPVGFFRLLTDGVNITYLMDLIVPANLRNVGIGSFIINWIKTNFPEHKILLLSNRAQNFYQHHKFDQVTHDMNYFLYNPRNKK